MSKKYLFINLSANLAAFAINFIIAFFVTPCIIEFIGKDTYGFMGLANNFTSYVLIITVALNSLAGRFVTISLCQNRIEDAKRYYNSVFFSNVILAVILFLPAVIFVVNLEKFLNIPSNNIWDIKLTFALVFFSFFINLIFSILSIATFAKNKVYLASIRSIQSNILRVIIIGIAFAFFPPKISYISGAFLATTIFVTLTNVVYTKKLLPEIKLSRNFYSFKKTLEILSSGCWNSIIVLSNVLLEGLDLLISNLLLGPVAMGTVAVVKIVPGMLNQLISSMMGAFLPQITIDYANGKTKEIAKYLNFSTKIIGMLMVLPLGFIIVYGNNFFKLWLPTEDANLLWILSILSLIGFVFAGSVNLFYNLFTVTNHLKMPAFVTLLTGVLNTLIVILLLKYTNMGIFAIVSISSILGILRNMCFNIPYAAWCINIKNIIFYQMAFRNILMLIIAIIVGVFIKCFVDISSWFNLISIACVVSFFALTLNFVVFLTRDEKNKLLFFIKQKIKRKKQ